MKYLLFIIATILSFSDTYAQIHMKKYNGFDSGGDGLYTIVGNHIRKYNGFDSGGDGLLTIVENNIRKYNGFDSGGDGLYTFSGINIREYNGFDSGGDGIFTVVGSTTISKSKIAAILLCEGIINGVN